MCNLAAKSIQNIRSKFEIDKYQDAFVAIDNDYIHNYLNDECVYFCDYMQQDTWIFPDNSFITRNDTQYWVGSNFEGEE